MFDPGIIVAIVGTLSVFGFPSALLGLHLFQRHREKMRLLESQSAGAGAVSALEAARADLEARVRTLESIVTTDDREFETRLRRLEAATPENSDQPRLRSSS